VLGVVQWLMGAGPHMTPLHFEELTRLKRELETLLNRIWAATRRLRRAGPPVSRTSEWPFSNGEL